MGAASATLLEKAASVPGGWDHSQRGPTLRKLFGAYTIDDLWALHRNFTAGSAQANVASDIDYDECQELIGLADAHQLFLWDLFSQQNELVDTTELFTLVCVFSGALLEEKLQFLMWIFDSSGCGSCGALTGSEVAKLLETVCGVFGRCTGAVVKKKDVAAALRAELVELVPAYQVGVERACGDAEIFFQCQRLIGLADLTQLLRGVKHVCDELPVSQPPPASVLHTPRISTSPRMSPAASPASARGPRLEMCKMFLNNVAENMDGSSSLMSTMDRASGSTSPASTSVSLAPSPPSTAGGGRASVRQLVAARRLERAEEVPMWMMESDFVPTLDNDCGGLPSRSIPNVSLVPERARMIFHGDAFCALIQDFPSFKRLFVKSVSYALGCQAAQIEALNVAHDKTVSIEFLVRAAGHARDTRAAKELLSLLEFQISNGHSVLRKGAFGVYAECAELVLGASVCTRPTTAPARGRAPITSAISSTLSAESQQCAPETSEKQFPATRTNRPKTAPKRASPPGVDDPEDLEDLIRANARLRLEIPEFSRGLDRQELSSSSMRKSLSLTRLSPGITEGAKSSSMSRSVSLTRLSPLCTGTRGTRAAEIGLLVACS